MTEFDSLEKIDVLLVDDRQDNLLALEAVLYSPQYNLIKVQSGDGALRYLLNNTPALILMDVQMPELNGFETATLIKGSERTREIPIIFVTAISKSEQFAHEGYEHGAVDYIYKPYSASILRSKVAVFAEIQTQHRRISRLVAAQCAATQALSNFTCVGDAIASVLQSICRSLGWDLGLFWRVDLASDRLVNKAIWQNPSRAPFAYVTQSLQMQFSKGTDLPGKVWAQGETVWCPEIVERDDFCRLPLAVQEKLYTTIGIPIWVQGEFLGVLEFASQKRQEKDNYLIKIIEAISSQVGQVLLRTEAFDVSQESIRLRDEFFSIASHELRTPVSYIKMMLQVVQRGLRSQDSPTFLSEKLPKMVETSLKQVNRLVCLIEDLLDIVKIQAGRLDFTFEEFDFSRVVREVIEQHTESFAAAKCSLEMNIVPDISGFWDRLRLEQVVINLVSNAIKYAPGKPIRFEVTRQGNDVRLWVQDFGPGISAELQPRIFERFSRAASSGNGSGLGLGLFIVKEIIHAHRGTIQLVSEVGKGSTFIVDLPTQRPDSLKSQGMLTSANPTGISLNWNRVESNHQ